LKENKQKYFQCQETSTSLEKINVSPYMHSLKFHWHHFIHW